MKKISAYLLLVILLCGCSAQLRKLMDLSGEQAGQHKFIESQRNKFKLLLNDIKNEKLNPGLSSAEIVKSYGEPIVLRGDQGQRVFLYRDPLDYNAAKKVYLFFDEKGILTKFKAMPEP